MKKIRLIQTVPRESWRLAGVGDLARNLNLKSRDASERPALRKSGRGSPLVAEGMLSHSPFPVCARHASLEFLQRPP